MRWTTSYLAYICLGKWLAPHKYKVMGLIPRGGYSHTWHAREVLWWWPQFLRFWIPILCLITVWLTPTYVEEKIIFSVSHLVPEIFGPKVGLLFHQNAFCINFLLAFPIGSNYWKFGEVSSLSSTPRTWHDKNVTLPTCQCISHSSNNIKIYNVNHIFPIMVYSCVTQ